MANINYCKEIIKDIRQITESLYSLNMIRDNNGISEKIIGRNKTALSFTGKNEANNIVYDKNISTEKMIEELLTNKQYSILLYDKSILQVEFIIENNEVIKERLVFIKKHNKLWNFEEINNFERAEIDWFADNFGCPIILRIDFDPDNFLELKHPACHLTLSNHESCRIPVKSVILFSEFVNFILFHFYNIDNNYAQNHYFTETISELEKKRIHLNW